MMRYPIIIVFKLRSHDGCDGFSVISSSTLMMHLAVLRRRVSFILRLASRSLLLIQLFNTLVFRIFNDKE